MSYSTRRPAPVPIAPAAVRDSLAAVAEGTEYLLRTVTDLEPEAVATPCALHGWTRGHLLAHLSRNADSLVNLLGGARNGQHIPQYGDAGARDRGIQDGAGRPLHEQLSDLHASAQRFAEAAAAMPDDAWSFQVRQPGGHAFPAAEIPRKRLREVEYHHVDLNAGYTPAHWAADFAMRELERLAAKFRGAQGVPPVLLKVEAAEQGLLIGTASEAPVLTVEGPVRGLVAWLSGRAAGDGLQVHRGGMQLGDPRSALPPLPPMG